MQLLNYQQKQSLFDVLNADEQDGEEQAKAMETLAKYVINLLEAIATGVKPYPV